MKALILVNGELYRPDILCGRIRTEVFDMVLGTDGGARHAGILDIKVDAIIGDMDSLSDAVPQSTANAELISYPTEKDETDLELTLLYVKEKGADKIVMVGAIGGRMDMTISNILLMTSVNLSSCRVEMWHGEGVTTRGLKYPLKDAKLSFGQARGISNMLEKPLAHVKLSDGLLLATHTPGRA